MAFGNFVLTDFGNSILVKAHAGKEIHFSRVALGDGDIGTSSVAAVTALKSEKLSLLIDAVSITDSDATVTVSLQSSAVTTGFYLKEMGLMATDPDTSTEGVYSYNRDSSDGEYVPDKNSTSTLSEYLRIHCSVAGASSITFSSSGNPLYITRDELNTEVSSQISAKAGVAGGLALYDTLQTFMASKGQAGGLALYDTLKTFMDSKGQAGGLASYDNSVPITRKVNGHALSGDVTVTAADVGLGNVNNTPDSAKSVNYAAAAGGFPAGGVAEIGQYLDFHVSGSSLDFDTRLNCLGVSAGLTVSSSPSGSANIKRNTVSASMPSGGQDGDGWDYTGS